MSNSNAMSNLENYGRRELAMVKDLLDAYIEGVPDWFSDYGVSIQMNSHSGNVFLTNEDCQVLMSDGEGGLQGHYFLSYNGNEGTVDSLWCDYEADCVSSEDFAELADILEQEDMVDEAAEVRKAIIMLGLCCPECDEDEELEETDETKGCNIGEMEVRCTCGHVWTEEL